MDAHWLLLLILSLVLTDKNFAPPYLVSLQKQPYNKTHRWSKDTGKRATKSKVEVLQGPNSIRQVFDLHCEGSTQPYHCVIETPGTGWTIRMWSKAPLEYPHEIVVEPYKVMDSGGSMLNNRLWWE